MKTFKDNKKKTLKSLNQVAKQFDLELVKGKGYFYWFGLTHEMGVKVSSLESAGVYVYRFSHLSWGQWLEELEIVKKNLGVSNE